MSVYDETILSKEDQAKLKVIQDAYIKAQSQGNKEGMSAAHDRAEAIRRAYGYSGGADGSGYKEIEGYEGAEQVNKSSDALADAYSKVAETYKTQAENQKAEIDKQTDSVLKQAYIQNMMTEKNLDQKLKASGMTGGLSETTRAGINQDYLNKQAAVQKSAIDAKKEIDINTNAAIAENELNKANAKYNSEMTKAQYQQAAANSNRNIEMNKQQMELNKELQNISKIQNGLVDGSNVKTISNNLGISEETAFRVSNAAKNADSAGIALNLLSEGIYDDSFVEILGGRFSADTLKTYANLIRNGRTSAVKKTTKDESDNEISDDEDSGFFNKIAGIVSDAKGFVSNLAFKKYAKENNYGDYFSEQNWKDLAEDMNMSVTELKAYMQTLKNSGE